MRESFLFITPNNPKGTPFSYDHARSLQRRIDRGENVGGWKLKNEEDRARLNLPDPPSPLIDQSTPDAANIRDDKGGSKNAKTESDNKSGGTA